MQSIAVTTAIKGRRRRQLVTGMVQSSVCGTLRVPRTFIFSLGQLRSIERFRTVETLGQMRLLTVETVDTVEMNRKVGIGWDPILL